MEPGHFEGRHRRSRSIGSGDGPPVILVCGGSVDRMSNAGLADILASDFTVLQLRPPRPRPQRRHAAVRGRAGDRGHRRRRRGGRRIGPPVRLVVGRGAGADAAAASCPADHEARALGAAVHPRRDRAAAGRPGRAVRHDAGRGPPRRRGRVLHGEGRRHAGRVRRRRPEPAVVGGDRGPRPHARRTTRRSWATTRCRPKRPRRSRSRRWSSTAGRASGSWARRPTPSRRPCPNGRAPDARGPGAQRRSDRPRRRR